MAALVYVTEVTFARDEALALPLPLRIEFMQSQGPIKIIDGTTNEIYF